jgi:hypothetical protein
MWMIEYNVGSSTLVWLFGTAIVVGRILHAYGMWSSSTPNIARMVGMLITYVLLFFGAVYLLLIALT